MTAENPSFETGAERQPFRFGVQAYSADSGAQWRDLARQAEDLGYSSFHLADHYFGPGPALDAANHPVQTVAAIPAMMAAAAATETIKVGCRVLCCDYHQPLVLAKELATIDLLSDGRLEPGFGAGWIQSEYEAMGVPWDRPGIRIDRMIEYVELARSFFNGDVLDHRGTYVSVSDTAAVPSSPQPGGPKIMIGVVHREFCAPQVPLQTSSRSTSTTRQGPSVRPASGRAPRRQQRRRSVGFERGRRSDSMMSSWRSPPISQT